MVRRGYGLRHLILTRSHGLAGKVREDLDRGSVFGRVDLAQQRMRLADDAIVSVVSSATGNLGIREYVQQLHHLYMKPLDRWFCIAEQISMQ